MYNDFIKFVKDLYPNQDFIPLHEPRFIGNEKKYLAECIDSTFVSSVGKFVDKFEAMIAEKAGVKYAVATVNGTAALHMCLILAGVQNNDEVITQPLTFVATCNAIAYCQATPVFIDVDLDTLGLSPASLAAFLEEKTYQKDGACFNKNSNKRIRACLPMHTFGHACRIVAIKKLCDAHNIVLIEDAAEALGSTYKDKQLGSYGKLAAISFNGNKIVTAGGGGVILTNDASLAKQAKHLTTTAKVPHKWCYEHDSIAYNYRMPNLNAALLCAQLENLDLFLKNKNKLALEYNSYFENHDFAEFIIAPEYSISNYWLNAIKLPDLKSRDLFLEETNSAGVMTRPIWQLMNNLKMFDGACCGNLDNSELLARTVVNIPSSVFK